MKTRFPLLLILFATLTFSQLLAQSPTGSLEGTIIARKGKIVTIQPTIFTGTDPQNGTVGDMSKYFEEKMGKMTMNGWLGVARVEFIPTTHQNTDIKILVEKSEMTVNGEKVDHFKIGKRIKIEWPAVEEEQKKED